MKDQAAREESPGIGDGFLSEVYRLSLLLGCVAAVALAVLDLSWGVSFAIGGFTSVVLLRTLEMAVKRGLSDEDLKVKRSLRLLALKKYPLVGLLFYILVKQSWLNVPALAGGLGLVYTVISMRAFWIGGVQLIRAGGSK